MSIAVVCPSRGRPQECALMVRSVVDTSNADVLLYFDEDDPTAPPRGAWSSSRVKVVHGPPIGRGLAVNSICDMFKDYRAYLVVSDDIEFTRTGWYEQTIGALDSFGDDIGIVHLSGSSIDQSDGDPWVNWACVSRRWIDAVGWLNYPECRWFCQDTVLQVLAEAIGRIARIEPVCLHHKCHSHPDAMDHLALDANKFLWFCAKDFGQCLKRLREAMR